MYRGEQLKIDKNDSVLPENKTEACKKFLWLVRKVAGGIARQLPARIDLRDLIGSGSIGLLDAIDKYDRTKCDNFIPYATIRIKGAILDCLRELDILPRSLRKLIRLYENAVRELQQEGRDLLDELIIAKMNEQLKAVANGEPITPVDSNKLEEIKAAARVLVRSIDELIDEHQAENIPDERDRLVLLLEFEARIIEVRETMPRVLSVIEQVVIEAYYFEGLKLKEIGEILDFTESRSSQILKDATKRLTVGINHPERIHKEAFALDLEREHVYEVMIGLMCERARRKTINKFCDALDWPLLDVEECDIHGLFKAIKPIVDTMKSLEREVFTLWMFENWTIYRIAKVLHNNGYDFPVSRFQEALFHAIQKVIIDAKERSKKGQSPAFVPKRLDLNLLTGVIRGLAQQHLPESVIAQTESPIDPSGDAAKPEAISATVDELAPGPSLSKDIKKNGEDPNVPAFNQLKRALGVQNGELTTDELFEQVRPFMDAALTQSQRENLLQTLFGKRTFDVHAHKTCVERTQVMIERTIAIARLVVAIERATK